MSILTEAECAQFNSFLTNFESPPPTSTAFAPYALPPASAAHLQPAPVEAYELKLPNKAQQTRELSDWFAATTAHSAPRSQPWPVEGHSSAYRSPRARSPPQARLGPNSSTAQSADATFARLIEAERAAGFGSGDLSGRSASAERRVALQPPPSHPNSHRHQPRPSTQLSNESHIFPSPAQPQPRPPQVKRESSDEQEPIVPVAPLATPSNIPPSPPGRVKPIAPPPRTPLATSTSGRVNGSKAEAAKPALLSASQKKANHIASESRRRAQIRKGYDSLVDVVPALKAAVEAAEREAAEGQGTKVKGKGKAGAKGAKKGNEDDKDKLDGRSGPKSEAVVLTKTVDRVQELLQHRQALLERLSQAYARAHHLDQSGARRYISAGPRRWEDKWVPGLDDEEDGEGEGEWDDQHDE